jgi:hypothetical protein
MSLSGEQRATLDAASGVSETEDIAMRNPLTGALAPLKNGARQRRSSL